MYSLANGEYSWARAFGDPHDYKVGLGLHLAITQGVFSSPLWVSGSATHLNSGDKFMTHAQPLGTRKIRPEILREDVVRQVMADSPYRDTALTADLRAAVLTGALNIQQSALVRLGVEIVQRLSGTNFDMLGEVKDLDLETAHATLHTLYLTSLAIFGRSRYWVSHIQRPGLPFVRIQSPINPGNNGFNIIGVQNIKADKYIRKTKLRAQDLARVYWRDGLPHTADGPRPLSEHIEINGTPKNLVDYLLAMSKDVLTCSRTSSSVTATPYPYERLNHEDYSPQQALHSALNWAIAYQHNPKKTKAMEKALGLDNYYGRHNHPGQVLDVLINCDEEIFERHEDPRVFDRWHFGTLQSPDLAHLLSYYLPVPIDQLIKDLYASTPDHATGVLSELTIASLRDPVKLQCGRGAEAINSLLLLHRQAALKSDLVSILSRTRDNLMLISS